jgi:MFS transporter, DHA3 family, macrolide efflux protein
VNQLLKSVGGRAFLTMWAGQSVSQLGSRLTAFAVGVWLYQKTGQATPLFLSAIFGFLPGVLLAPFAGVIVDRSDRRQVMLLVCIGHLLLSSLFYFLLRGDIQLWMIYTILAFGSAIETFQWPAEASSISVLVHKDQLGQANGLFSISSGVTDLAAPILGGILVTQIGIVGVVLLDLVSFAFEFITLNLIRIPRPTQSAEGSSMKSVGILEQAKDGFRFILERPGLLSLLVTFSGVNFIGGMIGELQAPLILARTGSSSILGIVGAAFGVGVLLGGVYMTSTGGPKPRVHGVFAGLGISGILGQALFGLAQSTPVWMLANFFAGFLLPVLNGSSQSIWQAKTPADIQGRVFTARRQIAQITGPVAALIAGPLADKVFTPVMNGSLGSSLSWLLGAAPGRGFAAMWVIFGILNSLTGFAGYLRPAARNVELEIPDAVN